MGVIVIEAWAKSGAIITAKAAIDQNREVMAVPGRIDSPCNAGAHRLLKDGARLIDGVEDVMETLGYIGHGLKHHATDAAAKAKDQVETPLFDVGRLNLSTMEQKIYNALDHHPLHVDEIIASTKLQAGQVNATLIALRLKGLIKQSPGNLFRKA